MLKTTASSTCQFQVESFPKNGKCWYSEERVCDMVQLEFVCPLLLTGVTVILVSFIPYTRVNKRIRLFSKLQGNMRLLHNMRLIMKAKLTTPPNRNACLVARVT